jgi:hypothetical protein
MIGKDRISKLVQTQHGYAVLTKIVRGAANNFPSSITGKSPRSRLTKPTRCLIGARDDKARRRRGPLYILAKYWTRSPLL